MPAASSDRGRSLRRALMAPVLNAQERGFPTRTIGADANPPPLQLVALPGCSSSPRRQSVQTKLCSGRRRRRPQRSLDKNLGRRRRLEAPTSRGVFRPNKVEPGIADSVRGVAESFALRVPDAGEHSGNSSVSILSAYSGFASACIITTVIGYPPSFDPSQFLDSCEATDATLEYRVWAVSTCGHPSRPVAPLACVRAIIGPSVAQRVRDRMASALR